jgi:hypothetical protein
MIGKLLTFGLGFAAGVYLAPQVNALRDEYGEMIGLPPAPEPVVEEIEPVAVVPTIASAPGVTIFVEEDTSEYDAAIEAFLHHANNALDGLSA